MIKAFSGFSPKKVPIADTFDCVVLAGWRAWETLALMGVGGGCGCRRRQGGEDKDKRPSNCVNFGEGGIPCIFLGTFMGEMESCFLPASPWLVPRCRFPYRGIALPGRIGGGGGGGMNGGVEAVGRSRTAPMMMMVWWWQGRRVDNRNPNGLVDWALY